MVIYGLNVFLNLTNPKFWNSSIYLVSKTGIVDDLFSEAMTCLTVTNVSVHLKFIGVLC